MYNERRTKQMLFRLLTALYINHDTQFLLLRYENFIITISKNKTMCAYSYMYKYILFIN